MTKNEAMWAAPSPIAFEGAVSAEAFDDAMKTALDLKAHGREMMQRDAEARQREEYERRAARGFLPEHVRVGPFRYAVQIEDRPFLADDNTVLCRQADHNAGRIRVMRAAPDRMFVTLWHELLHAIDDVAGTGLDEDTVNRLAPVLAGVLRDNVGVRGQ